MSGATPGSLLFQFIVPRQRPIQITISPSSHLQLRCFLAFWNLGAKSYAWLLASPSWLIVSVDTRHFQCPGPSSTLGALGPSHQRRHKSRVSLRGPPCAQGVADTPHGEVLGINIQLSRIICLTVHACWCIIFQHNRPDFVPLCILLSLLLLHPPHARLCGLGNRTHLVVITVSFYNIFATFRRWFKKYMGSLEFLQFSSILGQQICLSLLPLYTCVSIVYDFK